MSFLSMAGEDFERLTDNSSRWAGTNWQEQADRFETQNDEEIRWDWKMEYTVGGDYTAVILCREFLRSEGFDCQILFDTAEWPNGEFIGYTILTDYVSPCWLRSPGLDGIAIRGEADGRTVVYETEGN